MKTITKAAASALLLLALATPALANHPDGDPPNGPNVIEGTPGDDRLAGGHGRDLLIGKAGSDVLWGGRGPDIFRGGGGFDICHNRRGTGADVYVSCEVIDEG